MLYGTKPVLRSRSNTGQFIRDDQNLTVTAVSVSTTAEMIPVYGSTTDIIANTSYLDYISQLTEEGIIVSGTVSLKGVAHIVTTTYIEAVTTYLDAIKNVTSDSIVANTSSVFAVKFDSITKAILDGTVALKAIAHYASSTEIDIATTAVIESFFASVTSVIATTTASLKAIARQLTEDEIVANTTATLNAIALSDTEDEIVANTTAILNAIAHFDSITEVIVETTWIISDILVWLFNTETSAAWNYSNFPFNSIAVLDGTIIAAGDGGLYAVDQDDDAGTAIPWEIKFGLDDFGSQGLKRVSSVDVVGTLENSPVLKVDETRNGTRNQWHYKTVFPEDNSYREHVIYTAHGLKSRFFSFSLQGKGLAEIETINASVQPVKARH